MTRKTNGMGTIRKRSDGRYEARYTGPDGRQHSIYAATRTEVARKLRAATVSVDTGDWLQPNRVTVAEWLVTWLRDYCTNNRPTTIDNYETNIRLHINPIIGSLRLSSITSAHIRRVLNVMTNDGMAPRTVNAVRKILNSAMRAACEAQLIHSNPVDSVKRLDEKSCREIQFIDRPQIPDFIAAARQSPCASALLLMLYTGIRIGELLGLKWDRVNLSAMEITIDQQLVWHNKEYTLSPTKSGLARTLHITPEAADVLRAQRTAQLEEQLTAGANWVTTPLSDGLVFRTPTGSHMLFVTVQKAANRVGDAIGMPGLHPHSLRHSYAIAALRSGMDVKTLQHNLGHSSASVTLDVYAKYTDDSGAAAAARLSDYFSQLGSN